MEQLENVKEKQENIKGKCIKQKDKKKNQHFIMRKLNQIIQKDSLWKVRFMWEKYVQNFAEFLNDSKIQTHAVYKSYHQSLTLITGPCNF